MQPVIHYDYRLLRHTPAELRAEFAKLEWTRRELNPCPVAVSIRPRSPTTDRHPAAGLAPATSILPVRIAPAGRQSSTAGVSRGRLARLQRELKKLAAQRENWRQRRGRRAVPFLSIVGYMNAGKSTLLRALTRNEVHVADQMLTTLDPAAGATCTEPLRVACHDPGVTGGTSASGKFRGVCGSSWIPRMRVCSPLLPRRVGTTRSESGRAAGLFGEPWFCQQFKWSVIAPIEADRSTLDARDILGRSRSRGHRGTGNAAPAAIRRAPDADGTMTLRCIVSRRFEPDERDAAAELADALHDALDAATPASSNGSGR